MINNEKLGFKIVVNGTPVKNQIGKPLTIIGAEASERIASLETELGLLPIIASVKNGSATNITFDLYNNALQIHFTIPENGQFLGDLPLPCISTSTFGHWISFILNDENGACKSLMFTVYSKNK